jgi:platelet-activating factor acetylhydrolase IB subunit alpha
MPSGDQIVSCSWDKTVKVWELSTGFCLKTFEGHEGWINNLDINANGTRMVT